MAWISYKYLNKIFESELGRNEMLVLIGLSRYADKEGGNIFPAINRLAFDIAYSERQIIRIIKTLRQKEILIPVGKKRAGNLIYRIAIENALPKKSFDKAKETEALKDDERTIDDWGNDIK